MKATAFRQDVEFLLFPVDSIHARIRGVIEHLAGAEAISGQPVQSVRSKPPGSPYSLAIGENAPRGIDHSGRGEYVFGKALGGTN
jgi:hypothetical protein